MLPYTLNRYREFFSRILDLLNKACTSLLNNDEKKSEK